MELSINNREPKEQAALAVRALCFGEILLAYLWILVIDSACLFPAVWVR